MSAFAHVAEEASAAAVADVLELDEQPVRIGEVQLRCPPWRAATVFHPQADIRLHGARRAGRVASRGDAEPRERLEHVVWIEALHVHADMVDAGRTRRRGRRAIRGASATACASREHDERDARSDAEPERGALARSNRQTEELPVERVGSAGIGDADREVTEVAYGEQPLPWGRLGTGQAHVPES